MHIASFNTILQIMESFMERRSFDRIPVRIDARFFYGNMFYTGTVCDLSEGGMFIRTRKYLPANAIFLLMLRLNNKVLQIPAQVKRYVRTNGSRDGMGVVLMNSAKKEYAAFLNEVKMDVQTV